MTTNRLLSLDALRGFDMLFIMGFASLVTALCNLYPCGAAQWLAMQMGHTSWNGLTHHDTIFPLFLFIAGISFPFSLAKQRANSLSATKIHIKIVKRGLLLIALGFVYNGLFKLDFETMRYASVLGRIGIAWAVAAILFVNLRTRTLIIVSVLILLGYWLLMRYIAVPDMPFGSDPFSQEGNLVGFVDRQLLPGRLIYKTFDPEGLLSTIPAVVSAMLGMFTGLFVRLPNEKISGSRKSLYMLLGAVVMVIIGLLWGELFPINKKLWSSSFVCVVAGYSLAMFALFYYVIDVRGYQRWTLFFRVIGLNSITIYLAQKIVGFSGISNFFLGGIATRCGEQVGSAINAAGYVAVCWLLLYFLYKRGIFLKI